MLEETVEPGEETHLNTYRTIWPSHMPELVIKLVNVG